MNKLILALALLLVVIISTIWVKTAEGMAKRSEVWTQATQKKQDAMVKLGFSKELARSIITECKATAKDASNCVTVATFIGYNESTAGNNVTKCNNVFWVTGVCKDSKSAAVTDFVKRYNKYWYNQKTPTSFYSNKASVKPKTWYCLSEHSSNSKTFCPNGYANSWYAYDTYISLTK